MGFKTRFCWVRVLGFGMVQVFLDEARRLWRRVIFVVPTNPEPQRGRFAHLQSSFVSCCVATLSSSSLRSLSWRGASCCKCHGLRGECAAVAVVFGGDDGGGDSSGGCRGGGGNGGRKGAAGCCLLLTYFCFVVGCSVGHVFCCLVCLCAWDMPCLAKQLAVTKM